MEPRGSCGVVIKFVNTKHPLYGGVLCLGTTIKGEYIPRYTNYSKYFK